VALGNGSFTELCQWPHRTVFFLSWNSRVPRTCLDIFNFNAGCLRSEIDDHVLLFTGTNNVCYPAFSVRDSSSNHGVILYRPTVLYANNPTILCPTDFLSSTYRVHGADDLLLAYDLWCTGCIRAILLPSSSCTLASAWRVSSGAMLAHLLMLVSQFGDYSKKREQVVGCCIDGCSQP